MPQLLPPLFVAVGLLFTGAALASAAEDSSGLETLQGKWSGTRTNREGQRQTVLLEFNKNKAIYQVLNEDKQVRLFAKGTVKTEKAGPMNLLITSVLEAGRSADDLQAVDDTRTAVFAIRDGKLIVASNFDRDRERETPSLDVYDRVAAAKDAASTSGEAESKFLGKWKMQITMGEQDLDYDLNIIKASGKLEATVISPRSGEYKARSVVLKDNEIIIEVDRDIQGNAVTFVYKAKPSGEGLSGTISAKGLEEQFTGPLKARR